MYDAGVPSKTKASTHPSHPLPLMQPAVQLVGERQTVQRDAILQAITRAKGPRTVPEILAEATTTVGRLGIATVYRAVKLLLEAKLIRAVVLSDGQTRYEAANLGHHHHFRCRVCERVFDVHMCPVKLPAGTLVGEGFEVEDHEITLFGRCPKCAGKAPRRG